MDIVAIPSCQLNIKLSIVKMDLCIFSSCKSCIFMCTFIDELRVARQIHVFKDQGQSGQDNHPGAVQDAAIRVYVPIPLSEGHLYSRSDVS